MRNALALVGCGLGLAAICRAGEPIGISMVVASFRTGDTELFIVDPDTGDARNLTRSPGRASVTPPALRTARWSRSTRIATAPITSTSSTPMARACGN